jgi:hypothetical protein
MDELFLAILPVVKGFTALDDFTSPFFYLTVTVMSCLNCCIPK